MRCRRTDLTRVGTILVTRLDVVGVGVAEEKHAFLVALVKPQFELSPADVGKGGIVRDDDLRLKTLEKIQTFVSQDLNKSWRGAMESPISGSDGNREFLAWAGHG